MFAQFGLPETIVTDNGPCFVSAEFETSLARNGIKQLTSAPYHPSSNGLAERAVQLVKRGLNKITRGSMKSRLAQILFHYRLSPQTTTGVAPSELLLGRRPSGFVEASHCCRNRSVETPRESHTELDTTTPATVSSEPSTESPSTDSGAANETATSSNMPPEPTDAATNNSPTETARIYPNLSRNPVTRFEPTW